MSPRNIEDKMNTTIKTIGDMIEFYGTDRISNAVILPLGGEPETGSTSYWIPGHMLELTTEDTDATIERQLPDGIVIASDGSVWKVSE
jgi:hypothetical protein